MPKVKNMAEKITKELTWVELKDAYPIKPAKNLNMLADAIEAGEIYELLLACADQLHNGDFSKAIEAFRRNLSSTKCNRTKNDTFDSISMLRYNLLDTYTAQFVKTAANATVPGKAKWMYTVEDIESLRGNYEELRKLYNSLSDQKSKKPEAIVAVTTMEEFQARIDLTRELRNEAKAEAELPTILLTKLQANKKLTKEESEILVKLLTK